MSLIRVASTKDVSEDKPLCAMAGEKKLAIFSVKGKFFAIDNLCTHAGGPLCEGSVTDGTVTCPWHGSEFNVETGEVVKGPAKTAVAMYPTEIRGEDLFVDVSATTSSVGAGPKAVTFSFQPELDKERPFSNEAFVTGLMEGMEFPFKLYGRLKTVPIAQSADEIDLHLGEIHFTEVDLQKVSALMASLNAKYGTQITYCIFHTSRFPDALLLNIRGPKAPSDMGKDITF